MNSSLQHGRFAFPLVRPAFPEPAAWVPFLRESYDQHRFSNFGPAVSRLEAALADQFAEPGACFVMTASATAGLAACLIARNIDGRVLVPAFTFPATYAAVRMAGAEPLLIDVDASTWSCDLDKLGVALAKFRPQAVVLVAPFGMTQDFSAHVALCDAAEAIVIVDNAAGLGGGSRMRRPSRGGGFEVFSLHATKPLAVGEGGAILTDAQWTRSLRSSINFGLPQTRHASPAWGINGKMPEVSAAIGLAVLPGFPDVVRVRQVQAARYAELLQRFDQIVCCRRPTQAPWQIFPCLLPSAVMAEALVNEAQRYGLELRRLYRPSLDGWAGLKTVGDCSVAHDLGERMVALPIYSRTTENEIAELHRLVAQCLSKAMT